MRTLDISGSSDGVILPHLDARTGPLEHACFLDRQNSLGLEEVRSVNQMSEPITPPIDVDMGANCSWSQSSTRVPKARCDSLASSLQSLHTTSTTSQLNRQGDDNPTIEPACCTLGHRELDYVSQRLVEEQRKRTQKAAECQAVGEDERGRSRERKRAATWSVALH